MLKGKWDLLEGKINTQTPARQMPAKLQEQSNDIHLQMSTQCLGELVSTRMKDEAGPAESSEGEKHLEHSPKAKSRATRDHGLHACVGVEGIPEFAPCQAGV